MMLHADADVDEDAVGSGVICHGVVFARSRSKPQLVGDPLSSSGGDLA